MDMEVPFLFTDEDMYVALKVFTDDQVFNGILKKYDPPFISVPVRTTPFSRIIKKYPQFKPVFFDDREALYVNELRFPTIARAYSLEYIDPFTFSQSVPGLKDNPKADAVAAELERMYRIAPDNRVVNMGLSMIYCHKGDYPKAILHADAIIRNYPESHVGYAFKGDALKSARRYEEAINSYKDALKRSGGLITIHRDIGMIYFEQGQYRKAYDTFIRAANIYSPDTSYKDLYYVIYSAAGANLKKEARVLFHYGVQILPPGDTEWSAKYEELRSMIKGDEKERKER
jgi:tetratricopeptide (TPR) repeat protein